MYAVKYKERVILGIIPWDNKYIMDVMRNRHNVTVELPYLEPDASEFPLQVDAISVFEFLPPETITIYPAEEDRDVNINPMIQYYHGPTWETGETTITARYTIELLSMDDARDNHRHRAADMRWQQENRGVLVTVDDQEFRVSTQRDQRSKWVETLQNMGDTVNWKFGQVWTTLTRSQVANISAAVHAHVQAAFDEEMRLFDRIQQAQDHDQLLAITELLPPPTEPGD